MRWFGLLLGLASISASASRASAQADGDPSPASVRAERIARERAASAAALARMEALPWHETWPSRVEALLPSVRIDPRAVDAERSDTDHRWMETSDGYVARPALEFELAWRRPGQHRELPLCVDLEGEEHPFAAILDLHHQLAEHGIALLVVPVPSRIQVYPELLLDEEQRAATDWSVFRGYAPDVVRFELALQDAGVEVVDLLPALATDRFPAPDGPRDLAYLRYNQHWTPRSALAAAKVVAARIAELDGFPPGTAREGVDWVVTHWRGPWEPRRSQHDPEGTKPENLDFLDVATPDGKEVDFASKASPILVFGDSFVNHFTRERASFALHLYRFLAQPFDMVAVRGGGVLQTRRSLARRPAETAVGTKRIVVWVFSVTTLVEEEWQKVSFFPQ